MENRIVYLDFPGEIYFEDLLDLRNELPEDTKIIGGGSYGDTCVYFLKAYSKEFKEVRDDQSPPSVIVQPTCTGYSVDLSEVLEKSSPHPWIKASNELIESFNDLMKIPGRINGPVEASAAALNGITPTQLIWDAANREVTTSPKSPSWLDKFNVFDKPETSCVHQWKHYQGLVDSFDYCEKCDERKI